MMSGKDSVKTSRFAFLALGCLVLLIPCVSFAATDRTWTGGGDGITWGDPANWEGGNVPATTSDNAKIVSGASELVVSNDVARNISALKISGEGSVRIVGEKIRLEANNPAFNNSVPVAVDVPLDLEYTGSSHILLTCDTNATFNGKVTPTANSPIVRVTGDGSSVAFNESVVNANATLSLQMKKSGSGVYFYAPVDIKLFENAPTDRRDYYLASSGNKVSDGLNLHFVKAHLTVENALDESTPITFKYGVYKADGESTCCYFENGFNQVAKCISSDRPTYNGVWKNTDYVKAESAMTLTLKATEDASTYACLIGPLSLVFDPKTACTQTFLDRKHTTTGTITVKGGTVRMDGTNTFASVPTVTVGAGATFDVATTNTGALASVTELTLGAESRFAVAPTAVSLFGSSATFARALSSSRFVLPSGATLRVGSLVVDGAPVVPGNYSQTGDGASILSLAQVEGDGVLTVDSMPPGTWWTGAEDGDFNNAANWSSGVPNASTEGHVEKYGAVSVGVSAAPSATVKGLMLRNESGETALNVTAPVALAEGKVFVGTNAQVNVQGGGEWNHNFRNVSPSAASVESFGLHDGGKFIVSGGDVMFTNATGRLNIGGDAEGDEGSLEISSGRFEVQHYSGDFIYVNKHGKIKMTGGEFVSKQFHLLKLNGGTIDLSGDASMVNARSANATFLGTGMLKMRGTSVLSSREASKRWNLSPIAAGETLSIDIDDNAVFNFGNADWTALCDIDGGRTVLKMRGGARFYFGNAAHLGRGAGTYGELDMGDNTLFSPKSNPTFSYGMIIGQNGTTSSPARGVFKISGGGVYLRRDDESARTQLRGLIVGDGSSGTYDSPIAEGRIEISGGVITNANGTSFALGVGSAVGVVTQSGGKMLHTGGRPFLIGLRGGRGTYSMTGGELHANGAMDTYVGGAQTNRINYYFSALDDKPAYGTMSVMGGTVSVTRSIYVSDGGYGTLEIGPTGRVEVAQNVYLTNSVDAVKSVVASATLKFVIGNDGGCGRLDVAGMCQISADAKLVVDATQVATPQSVMLMTYGSRSGEFAAENIEILAANPGRYRVDQQAGTIRLVQNLGMMLIVR